MQNTDWIQDRYQQITLDDYENNYHALLQQSGKSAMEVKRLAL